MFIAKPLILAILLVALHVSADTVVEDKSVDRSSNSSESEPMTETTVTPSSSVATYFGGLFNGLLAQNSSPFRKMCDCSKF